MTNENYYQIDFKYKNNIKGVPRGYELLIEELKFELATLPIHKDLKPNEDCIIIKTEKYLIDGLEESKSFYAGLNSIPNLESYVVLTTDKENAKNRRRIECGSIYDEWK
jgi:hypothetical protein